MVLIKLEYDYSSKFRPSTRLFLGFLWVFALVPFLLELNIGLPWEHAARLQRLVETIKRCFDIFIVLSKAILDFKLSSEEVSDDS